MTFEDRIKAAAALGRAAVAVELGSEGEQFDRQRLNPQVRSELASYPRGNLFCKCIVHTAMWAGFVQDDPAWPTNVMQFLETQAPHIKWYYKKGFRANANPIAYLESWNQILQDRNVPAAPDATCTVQGLARFHQNAFAALKALEWKHQRSWLGPWTFHGAFKIYLLHENRLWPESLVDAITMPMGGAPGKYSFEAGWSKLENLGILPTLPTATNFDSKMAVVAQAHAEVLALASLASRRALHVNSGIYLLGSD